MSRNRVASGRGRGRAGRDEPVSEGRVLFQRVMRGTVLCRGCSVPFFRDVETRADFRRLLLIERWRERDKLGWFCPPCLEERAVRGRGGRIPALAKKQNRLLLEMERVGGRWLPRRLAREMGSTRGAIYKFREKLIRAGLWRWPIEPLPKGYRPSGYVPPEVGGVEGGESAERKAGRLRKAIAEVF